MRSVPDFWLILVLSWGPGLICNIMQIRLLTPMLSPSASSIRDRSSSLNSIMVCPSFCLASKTVSDVGGWDCFPETRNPIYPNMSKIPARWSKLVWWPRLLYWLFLVGGAAQPVRPARRKGGTPTQSWWHCPRHGARPFRELYAPAPPIPESPVWAPSDKLRS